MAEGNMRDQDRVSWVSGPLPVSESGWELGGGG